MISIMVRVILYLIMFTIAMYGVSGIKFDKFMSVATPNKVRIIAILIAMALAYLTSEFLMGMLIFIA